MSPGSTKKTSEAAKAAPEVVSQSSVVTVKNVSDFDICTSKENIKAGDKGQATVAELRQLNKFLEKA